ncbi:DUF1107 domain-containing protein [Motilimonas eburnea]|uniref:DUF1107 domain-containing protein n=1 Tax=Motilimonas eburnea TaxID=1737488 RepID=UPI001E441830|nr:DUF1107 domain-containing protein [Motilimonas eburnea]MCE2572789.1 DUF1107 domain-containing protein [Motilimonas eburnea]
MNVAVSLRTFKKYHPRQVAKHIKAFFNGRIYIVGIGRFRVVNGKLVAYKDADKKALSVMSEVNRIIKEMQMQQSVAA